MTARPRGLAALLLATILAAHIGEPLAFAAPLLLLLAVLLCGCYPGERLLTPRRTRRREPPRRPGHFALPRPERLTRPRGGGLIARSLAGRAPPR